MGGWGLTLQAAWYVRHTHWAYLCYVPIEIYSWWITSTTWLLILSSTSFMVGRSRVFYIYLFLMKVLGRWLPWVPPGPTGRFYEDDVVHNHSANSLYEYQTVITFPSSWYHGYKAHAIRSLIAILIVALGKVGFTFFFLIRGDETPQQTTATSGSLNRQ